MNEIIRADAAEIVEGRATIGAAIFQRFIDYIDRCPNTTRTYIINLRQFAGWMQENGITAPTREDVISYRDSMTARGLKPNTVTGYLRAVKQFFTWTAAEGLYPNVAANIHAPKVNAKDHKKDALDPADVLTIEKSIAAVGAQKTAAAADAVKDTAGRVQRATEQEARLNAMYLLAVNAGLRTVEIHRANVKDIETKGGSTWLYIWGKGHSEPDQKKPIAPEVAVAIREYIATRKDHPTGSSPLFVSTGNRAAGQRIATTTISTMLKRAMQAAGYDSERITAHSLRHTAGTAVQEITGDLYQTQKYMRHANPATTEIYLHNEDEQREAATAQQLYDLYHGRTARSTRDKIESTLAKMSGKQLEQLAAIVAAMA